MIRATESTSTPEHTYKLLDRRVLAETALVFVAAGVLLFLFSTRIVNVFDEGILLTGSMRTMAGQVLHRDFNYNYGPAQLYLLAGLFKLFGSSVLVERLMDASFAAALVATVYVLVRKFCGRSLALVAAVICMLWSTGLTMTENPINTALCVLTLWTSWLILPVSNEGTQSRRALCAGFLAAIMFLFRYDMGIATVAANLFAMAVMVWLQPSADSKSIRRLLAKMAGPYVAAFGITVAPAAIAYLCVAPLQDLLYDVVIYMAKYYRLGRALPFPAVRPGVPLVNIGLYLLPFILLLSFWMAARWVLAEKRSGANPTSRQVPEWVNLLVSLSIAATVICVKGLVRAGLATMYGSVIACLLLAIILFHHRRLLDVWARGLLTVTFLLFVLAAASGAKLEVSDHWHLKPLVINRLLTPGKQPPSAAFRSWCDENTPITKGFCFLLDEDHIQTVRYLDAHTRPGDYLYVGLNHHDRIFANDMITYFAVQRPPAVKWTEMDPFLENRADIQQEMIGDLEQHKPEYVVLDSEFDQIWEPNGSSVSTGVHLLDDYIAAHYKTVQQYGELTILKRQ